MLKFEELKDKIMQNSSVRVRLFDGTIWRLIGVCTSQNRFFGKFRNCENATEYSIYYDEIREILDE